ncbi:hypothetical protein EON62_05370, partial [archaeon]
TPFLARAVRRYVLGTPSSVSPVRVVSSLDSLATLLLTMATTVSISAYVVSRLFAQALAGKSASAGNTVGGSPASPATSHAPRKAGRRGTRANRQNGDGGLTGAQDGGDGAQPTSSSTSSDNLFPGVALAKEVRLGEGVLGSESHESVESNSATPTPAPSPPAAAAAVAVADALEAGAGSAREGNSSQAVRSAPPRDTAVVPKLHGDKLLLGSLVLLRNEELGRGSHGTIVYRGLYDKRHVAVKRLLLTHAAHAKREIELLIRTDGHPHVVRYFSYAKDSDFLYLALELCEGSVTKIVDQQLSAALRRQAAPHVGSLANAAAMEGYGTGAAASATAALVLPTAQATESTRRFLHELVEGVQFLHSKHIVHRDLKPQNILVAKRHRHAGSRGAAHASATGRGIH